MKIHVRSVDVEHQRVEFDSEVGSVDAGWRGPLPAVNRDYDVNILIDHRLAWGTEIVASDTATSRIAREQSGIELRGTLESIDADGAGALRLGSALVPIETEGTPAKPGTPVHIRVSRIELTAA